MKCKRQFVLRRSFLLYCPRYPLYVQTLVYTLQIAMKKICILCGSPRRDGNTNQLVRCFANEAEANGCEVRLLHLYDMELRPCLSCRACQKDWTVFGCCQRDDMQRVFDEIAWCDLLVLASPIYSWYCTPPMKAVLDRMVYSMNKYYGEKKAPLFGRARRSHSLRPVVTVPSRARICGRMA